MVLQLLSGTDYLNAFQPEQLNALAMLFLNAYGYGSLIWGLFFNLHLIVIAYLIIKSGFFPKNSRRVVYIRIIGIFDR